MTQESTEQSAQRRAKLAELRARGQAYPNDFRPDARAGALHARFGDATAEDLEHEPVAVAIAGRMMTRRLMGKRASHTFATARETSRSTCAATTCRRGSTPSSSGSTSETSSRSRVWCSAPERTS